MFYQILIDFLSNFKRMSAACKALRVDTSTPLGAAMFLTLLKIDRIINPDKKISIFIFEE
jgi:hypothetical protein